MKKCKTCGQEFESPKGQKNCSPPCAKKAKTKGLLEYHNNVPRSWTECIKCGDKIIYKAYKGRPIPKKCHRCKSRDWERGKRRIWEVQCEGCGKRFSHESKPPPPRVCSDCLLERRAEGVRRYVAEVKSGKRETKTVKLVCVVCNKSFHYKMKHGSAPKVCSPACSRKRRKMAAERKKGELARAIKENGWIVSSCGYCSRPLSDPMQRYHKLCREKLNAYRKSEKKKRQGPKERQCVLCGKIFLSSRYRKYCDGCRGPDPEKSYQKLKRQKDAFMATHKKADVDRERREESAARDTILSASVDPGSWKKLWMGE